MKMRLGICMAALALASPASAMAGSTAHWHANRPALQSILGGLHIHQDRPRPLLLLADYR